MDVAKLETMRTLALRAPRNPLARFGLANEAMKHELWDEALEHLSAYVSLHDDEGNGYGRLAEVLAKLGRTEEAANALKQGIEHAARHGHPGLADDLTERLTLLEES
jgi:uncharacterized protein HemY